jgi:hypothetical protein
MAAIGAVLTARSGPLARQPRNDAPGACTGVSCTSGRRTGKSRNRATGRARLGTDVTRFDLIWKVLNRGEKAEGRGQLITGEQGLEHRESTLYRRKHFIAVYVIKNGRVVASDHHEVLID